MLAVGTRVRTFFFFECRDRDGIWRDVPKGTEGVVTGHLETSWFGTPTGTNAIVSLPTFNIETQIAPSELEVIPPTIEQQLADAIARAERAEQQVAVLKAFVEGLATRAPKERPNMKDYHSVDGDMTYYIDYSRRVEQWLVGNEARMALAVAEKAVGDE